MAIALGVVPQTVNKWAKGLNGPEPEMFGPIEEFLDLEAGTLLAAYGARHEAETVTPQHLVADIVAELMALREEVARLGAAVATLAAPPQSRPPDESPSPRPAPRAKPGVAR